MTAIRISNLTKDFGARRAVDDLTLSIADGELFALLGPNGAGKTVTIKMLCCLLAPTSGDAVLLGDSIRTAPGAVKQKINLSPQETAVAPKLSVAENLELIARIYGCPKGEARSRTAELLEQLHLTDRATEKARSLSGGLQRRLSLGMALITRPRIVFLDEPTLGLDVRARRDLWRVLESIKGSTTVVLTTHYLEEAEALADRIGIMHTGRLRALGTAEELKQLTGTAAFEEAFLALTESGEQP